MMTVCCAASLCSVPYRSGAEYKQTMYPGRAGHSVGCALLLKPATNSLITLLCRTLDPREREAVTAYCMGSRAR